MVVLARGKYKTMAALLGLHHLVSVPGARVVIGAMAKDAAGVTIRASQCEWFPRRGFSAQELRLLERQEIRDAQLRDQQEPFYGLGPP